MSRYFTFTAEPYVTKENIVEIMHTVELLPCPFCGSKYTQIRYMGGKWQEPSAFDSGYRCECCECGVITAAYSMEGAAITAWNRRA